MDAATITFGVEIECTVAADAFYAAGWIVGGYHRGAGIPGFAGWQTQSDSSIHFVGRNRLAVEVVSPVLVGAAGLASLKAMVATLKTLGAKVNATCGFHVHVGFPTNDIEALTRLIHLTARVEPALHAATGTLARRHNHYCQSVKAGFAALKGKKVADLRGLRTTCAAVGSRYHVLNLTNLLGGVRPTVEFRVFAGTLNAAKMAAYVQLAVGLVQHACEVKRCAEWDAPVVTATSSLRKTGAAATDVFRLVTLLGWNKACRGTKARGILAAATIKPAIAILMAMAAKFDTAAGTTYPAPAPRANAPVVAAPAVEPFVMPDIEF